MILIVRRAQCTVVALSCLLASATARAQQPADAAFPIGTIDVTGATRFKIEQVVQVSGLNIGSKVTVAELQAAAKRMTETGMFSNVSYRYTLSDSRFNITFDIEEAKWTIPVVFDNFVWMTQAEIAAEIAREMLTFDGSVPATDNARNFLTAILQKSLVSRRLPGTAVVVPSLNLKTRAQQYLARVASPSPTVCAVRLSGASPAMGREVKSVTDPMTSTDYSRSYLLAMSAGTLVDLYRKHGYWGIVVSEPETALDASCGGVTVTLAFSEGPVYQWDGADWSGNTALSAEQLTPLLSLRAGDVADNTKLEAGLRKILESYGTVGHLAASVTSAPQLNPQTQRARFAFAVTEGPQFRMGTLTVNGLDPKDAASLQKKWKLKAGDVFNNAVAQAFSRDDLAPFLRQKGFKPTSIGVRPGAAPLTVDVTISARK